MTETWMVTGTSRGFGKALARQLAQRDDIRLIATARHMKDLDYLDQYDHGQIKKVLVDVSKPAEVKKAAADAKDFADEIDVLVNNAGIGYFSTIEESNLDEVRYMFDVNFFGLAQMTDEILPVMRKQKHGVIVNISSALALTTLPTMGFYSASKYAVEGYSDTLRQEVADLGIKVFTVEPSGARTDWSGSSSEKEVPTINDYDQFKDMVANVDASVTDAPGDPKLIAKAIIDGAESDDVPEHLPLGQFAYDGSLKNLANLTKEIKSRKDISLSTDQQ